MLIKKIDWKNYVQIQDHYLSLFVGNKIATFNAASGCWSTTTELSHLFIYNLNRQNRNGMRVFAFPLLLPFEKNNEERLARAIGKQDQLAHQAEVLVASARDGFDIFRWIPNMRAFDRRIPFKGHKIVGPKKSTS